MWGEVGQSGYTSIANIFCQLTVLEDRVSVTSFKGEFEHSVDQKGRISFPAKLRKAVSPQAQDRFTILKGLENCLYLYPEDEWQKVEDRLSKINNFTREGSMVIRNFLRSAQDIELDRQNRLALPPRLMQWASIQEKAIFIGTGNRIEIWSPDRLAKADEDLSMESYQELFEQVMTNVDQ